MEKKENYFNSPEFQETLHRYESSLQEDHPEYFGSNELSDIAEYYYYSGKRKEAVDVLDYAIQLHPGAAMPLVFKGRIALIDNKDIDTAQHYADMISDQLDLDCLYLQAEIMITRGNVEEADNFLNNAMHQIDEDDVPDYVLDIATIFIDYNQPDIAAKWLAMSDEDDLLDYREVKARIAFAKGDYEQSEQIFEQLLDEDPYSGKYWNSLAVTQLMSNRINDSITSSEYSIAIDPEDEEALLNKANGLFSLGNFTEAMDYYQRFLKLCPEEGAAYMFVGNCLLNMGRPEEAMPQYNKALECFKKYNISTSEVNQCRAFTLSQLGHIEQALECLAETDNDSFEEVRKALEDAGIPMMSAEVTMIPQNYVTLTDETAIKNLQRTLDLLDEDDDVQAVYKYERGKGYPQADTMFALMELYGAGLEDIVRRPEETKKAALVRLDERQRRQADLSKSA